MSALFVMQNVMATSSFGRKKSSVKAKIVGSTVAGVSEICIFHPIDTVAKRLMNNKIKIQSTEMFKSVALNNSGVSKLYAGISAGFLYKVSQRTYKYGGQSYLNDSLQKNFNASKLVSQSLSGCMIGMGEVFLLPLDILKIRTQLFPEKYVVSVRAQSARISMFSPFHASIMSLILQEYHSKINARMRTRLR